MFKSVTLSIILFNKHIISMILFPNAKINIGLNVLETLDNGYHLVETVMVPIGWCDILEIVPSRSGKTSLQTSGRPVACPPEKNLVMKAWRKISETVGQLPPVDIFLHKIVPDGAGLGGGSSDAAFTLIGLNNIFELGLSDDSLASIASGVGADCPFFIYNRPMLATGIGTDLSPVDLPPFDGYIVVAKPSGSVSTAEAYSNVEVRRPQNGLLEILNSMPDCDWKLLSCKNAFEKSVFPIVHEAALIKQCMMQQGAVYASMSGSGSAVYGLFDNDKLAEQAYRELSGYEVFFSRFHL